MTEIPFDGLVSIRQFALQIARDTVNGGSAAAVVDAARQYETFLCGSPTGTKGEPPTPAVSIKKSIYPDYLVCLDNGLTFKSLKRHLASLGMTPDQYRAKWGLPSDYPMVAPNYATARRDLAKKMGLGKIREKGHGQ